MLPRFSIASSRRTMTPRRLMARAPAERVTLMIAGKQFRRQPDGEGDGKEERLDHRTMRAAGSPSAPTRTMIDHHPDEQIAELAYAALEVGLGLARFQPRGDRRRRRCAGRSRRR